MMSYLINFKTAKNIGENFQRKMGDSVKYSNYLDSLTLKVFEIIIGNCGDGTTAPAPAPAGTHSVKVTVLQIATLVIGAVVSVAKSLTISSLKEILMKILLKTLFRVIALL